MQQEVAGSEWTSVPLKGNEQVPLPWILPGQPNSILEILPILTQSFEDTLAISTGTILDLLTVSWLADTVLRGRSQAASAEMLAQDINALNSRTDGCGEKGMTAGIESTALGRGSRHWGHRACVTPLIQTGGSESPWISSENNALRRRAGR